MNETSLIQDCLAQFDIRSAKFESLGNAGGFSGSEIYKVSTPHATYCLKRWPNAATADRILWIHRVLIFAAANGCQELTTPKLTRDGKTFLSLGQSHWELTRWASGTTNLGEHATTNKLRSAVDFLARFHQATARFHFSFSPSENVGKSVQRLLQFDEITSAAAASSADYYLPSQMRREFAHKGRALAASLSSQLAEFGDVPLPSQPVIRDLRAEHLFFDGDKLVDVIDFGAMRIDSVACDLARMLGDCCVDDQQFQEALDAYHATRPLSAAERQLIPILESTTVLVGILNWLDWLFCQQRRFEDAENVRGRLSSLFQRFERLAQDRLFRP